MRLSTHDLRRKPRCSDHKWSEPMNVAGMERRLCLRCGQISLEPTVESFTLPESLRRQTAVTH